MTLISLENVSKSYSSGENSLLALNDVCLRIDAGEFASVCGPSGSGKSSLLNIIGLLDGASSGRVVIGGHDTQLLNEAALTDFRYQMIGFVFQSFNLVPVLSALENVMLPLQMRGESEVSSQHRAEELLEAVGLARFLASRPDKMSGGQRQRVAIARALVTRPKLVLADEPTANLDSSTSQMIINLMHELNQTQGVTFLFSTHDTQLLNNVNRHIHIRDGSVIGDQLHEVRRHDVAADSVGKIFETKIHGMEAITP